MEKLRMSWNNLSSWLKGGIIGIIIAITWAIYLFKFQFLTCSDLWGRGVPNYCYILFPINGTMGGISGILNLLLFPVCGAFIGWIVGKIRNNKMASQIKSKKGVKK